MTDQGFLFESMVQTAKETPHRMTTVVSTAMRAAHGDGPIVHDIAPAYRSQVIPDWNDCLTCRICGHTLVTRRGFQAAPPWLQAYLVSLALDDWLTIVAEVDDAGSP